MLKIHILDRCEFCDGQAYVYACEFVDVNGEAYPRYMPCAYCKGSGELDKWVELKEFVKLLQKYECPHEHTTTNGGFHFTAGEVWDDLAEVCDDCGANLDTP